MSVYIKPEFQIQRINDLENRLNAWKSNATDQWKHRPDSKSWSPIEVMQHMVLAHKVYRDKVRSALNWEVSTEIGNAIKASRIPSFLIQRFPPKDQRIRFKMKTMKQFKPILSVEHLSDQEIEQVWEEMTNSLSELKSWVEKYRNNPISMKKFNSAIGSVVRFNVPEACEFILCHNERHFLQVDRAFVN